MKTVAAHLVCVVGVIPWNLLYSSDLQVGYLPYRWNWCDFGNRGCCKNLCSWEIQILPFAATVGKIEPTIVCLCHEAQFEDTEMLLYGDVMQTYAEAEEILLRVNGFLHPSLDRLYLNLGIAHEESGDYYKAFHYFQRWFENCRELYGLEHNKTRRPISTLNEPMYKRIAAELSVDIPAPLTADNA